MIASFFRFIFRCIYSMFYLGLCAFVGVIISAITAMLVKAILFVFGLASISHAVGSFIFIAIFGLFMIECIRWLFVKKEKPITIKRKSNRTKRYHYTTT